MLRLGPTELIIILVIIILLFGVGRIGKIAGEMGQGIRSFREGLKDEDQAKGEPKAEEKAEEAAPLQANASGTESSNASTQNDTSGPANS